MSHILELFQPSEHLSVSEIRGLNRKRLKALGGLALIHHGAKPVAAIFPYASYMAIQRHLQAYQERVEELDRARASTERTKG